MLLLVLILMFLIFTETKQAIFVGTIILDVAASIVVKGRAAWISEMVRRGLVRKGNQGVYLKDRRKEVC